MPGKQEAGSRHLLRGCCVGVALTDGSHLRSSCDNCPPLTTATGTRSPTPPRPLPLPLPTTFLAHTPAPLQFPELKTPFFPLIQLPHPKSLKAACQSLC